MTQFDLSGMCAVVTGGSRGIGLAIVRALADAGARVASWSRDLASNRRAVAGVDAIAVCCDVSRPEDVRRAFDETVAALGKVDILVVNAGRPGEDVLFPDCELPEWDAIIATNLTAPFTCIRAFAQHAIARGGGGKVVVISSIGAEFAMPRAVAYSAAKAGLTGLTRSVAVALARHDVQVNCVEPGWTDTEMSARQVHGERTGPALIKRTPARRFARPEDIAGVCVYLASPASHFHTGDVIRVDGGFVVA
jgi:NAD(P)-dependent dehydrogenase (short-subunit alcohol dehydrogenase family)